MSDHVDAHVAAVLVLSALTMIGALLLTAKQCSRLQEQRRRRRKDAGDGMASMAQKDLNEAKEVFRFLEQSNREMKKEVKSMRAMQTQTRAQLQVIKQAVAKIRKTRKPSVEPVKDD